MAVSKRTKYTSKGERSSVSRSVTNAVRRDRPYIETLTHKVNAWAKGKKVWVTIPNPNPNETNKRFIRVDACNPAAFGPWKKDTGIKISND